MEKHGNWVDATKPYVIMVVFYLISLSHFCRAEGSAKVIDLEEAYRLSLKNHEQIQIAMIEMGKSGLLPKKATTIMMPRMTTSVSYTRLNDPIEFETQLGNILLPPIQTVPEDQTAWNFGIVQPIYVGQFFPARQKAKQAVEWSTESYCKTVQEVLFKVAQAYYEALKGERLVQNARETLLLAEEELRVSRVKFKAGDVTEDTVLRAQLEISRAQSKIIKNVNSLKIAKDVLKRITGIEDQDVGVIEPPELTEETTGYDELLLKAFENRYDYRQASVAVKMAETDIELVYAKFHPRLGASWDYKMISDPAWNQEDHYWVAGVKLEIPLFEGGERYYDLKEKKESLRQAGLALDDLRQNIQIDLKRALLSMETEKSLIDNSANEVRLAVKNYDIISSKYHYGAATFSDLAEARLYLDSARTDFITTTFDRQVSILNVQRAVGQLAREYIE